MKKIKMSRGVTLTFEEGCNKYLDNCRARNLREGTIGHYRQSYVQFYKYFGKELMVKDIDKSVYDKGYCSFIAIPRFLFVHAYMRQPQIYLNCNFYLVYIILLAFHARIID